MLAPWRLCSDSVFPQCLSDERCASRLLCEVCLNPSPLLELTASSEPPCPKQIFCFKINSSCISIFPIKLGSHMLELRRNLGSIFLLPRFFSQCRLIIYLLISLPFGSLSREGTKTYLHLYLQYQSQWVVMLFLVEGPRVLGSRGRGSSFSRGLCACPVLGPGTASQADGAAGCVTLDVVVSVSLQN